MGLHSSGICAAQRVCRAAAVRNSSACQALHAPASRSSSRRVTTTPVKETEGPMLCFKGIDNAAYYRLADDAAHTSITRARQHLMFRHPNVLQLIWTAATGPREHSTAFGLISPPPGGARHRYLSVPLTIRSRKVTTEVAPQPRDVGEPSRRHGRLMDQVRTDSNAARAPGRRRDQTESRRRASRGPVAQAVHDAAARSGADIQGVAVPCNRVVSGIVGDAIVGRVVDALEA